MGCSASEPEVKEFKKGRPNTSTAPLSMDSISLYSQNNNNTEMIIKGVGLFGNFGMYKKNLSHTLPLLYREVFTSPITIPAGSSFIYRLETTVGE